MNITKLIKFPDYITLLNVISGVLAIFFVMQGQPKVACYLLFAAVVFDFLDGKAARWTGVAHTFGAQLDSLADIISFGLAPAVLGFSILPNTVTTIVVLIFFVCCGILRLARFNITKKKGIYEGVPITLNGILFPLFFLFGLKTNLFLGAYAAMGALMISSLKIKKVM